MPALLSLRQVSQVQQESLFTISNWKPQHVPADKPKPGEAIIERIIASEAVDVELRRGRGQLCLVVVHLSHQLETLSVNPNDYFNDQPSHFKCRTQTVDDSESILLNTEWHLVNH